MRGSHQLSEQSLVGPPVMLGSRDSRCAAVRRLEVLLLWSTSAEAAYSSRGFRWERKAAGAADTAAITHSTGGPGSLHVSLLSPVHWGHPT